MMKKVFFRSIVWVVLSTGFCVSCDSASIFGIPNQTEDGWPTASLKSVGMDKEPLSDLVARIENKTYKNIHSVLIIKDGKLVFEQYFSGYAWAYNDQFQGELVAWDKDTIHNLASVTKSFTSTLIGIAIDQGLMQGIADSVLTYFAEYDSLFEEGKEKLILEHLLTMRAGLEWNEEELPFSDTNNDLVRLFWVADPISYILSKQLSHEPGTHFYYRWELHVKESDGRDYHKSYTACAVVLRSGGITLNPPEVSGQAPL